MNIDVLKIICMMSVITYATLSDLATYKVKNWIYVVGWVISFCFTIYSEGISGVCVWSVRSGLMIIILIPIYLLKVIAGADVKAFSVICSFIGMDRTLTVVVISFLFAAVISVVKLIVILVSGLRAECISDFYWLIRMYGTEFKNNTDELIKKFHRIHFMVPIWIGLISVICVTW